MALGDEIPAVFCNDDALAADLLDASAAAADPMWRMPLYEPYRSLLDSKIADLNNIARGRYGGAITAALFLAHFVDKSIPWAHLDLMAWNSKSRPGRPEGGEATALRALYGMLKTRYPA